MIGKKIDNTDYSTKYIRSFKKLPSLIQQKAREKETIFTADCFDSRLDTHKLHGKFRNYWAYSVDHKYRVIFRFIDPQDALFLDVGTHDLYQ